MHDSVSNWTMADQRDPVGVKLAIELIEAGKADEALVVDLGDGVLARANGRLGLQGLLQRLRGYRLVQTLANADAPEEIVSLRSDAPEMHPDVAIILDALKN